MDYNSIEDAVIVDEDSSAIEEKEITSDEFSVEEIPSEEAVGEIKPTAYGIANSSMNEETEEQVKMHSVAQSAPLSEVSGQKEMGTTGDEGVVDEIMEVELDLSKIEFDKEGIPVLKYEEREAIKKSGLAGPSFTAEISSARDTIIYTRKELDITNQEKIEKETIEKINELENELVQENITKEDIEVKKALIEVFKNLVDNLPKNNEEVKKLLEEQLDSSIKVIATYQSIARKDIGDLVNDGSLVSLISNIAVTNFAQSYIDEYLEYNEFKFSSDKQYEKIDMDLTLKEKESEKLTKELDELNKISPKSPKVKKGEEIDHEIQEKYNEDYKIWEEKAAKIRKEKEEVDKESKELTSLLNKYVDENIYEPIKERIRKQGLAITMIEYGNMVERKRSKLLQNINYLSPYYLENVSNSFYFLIKSLIRKNIADEFNIVKTNVNNISIFQNHILHYLESLFNNKVTEEWALKFDEHSELKKFYYENEKEISQYFTRYNDSKVDFYKLMKDNSLFMRTVEANGMYLLTDFNKKQEKLEKNNSKLKNKYKDHLYIGFQNQFIVGLKDYLIKIKEKDESESLNKFYETYMHNTLGGNLINGFLYFKEKLSTDYSNKFLADDCMQYLFHEFILSMWTLKSCESNKVPIDFMKEKVKTIIFKSANFAFMNKMDLNVARGRLFKIVLETATTVNNNIGSMYKKQEDELRDEYNKRINNPLKEEVSLTPKKLTDKEKELEIQKKRKLQKKKEKGNSEARKFMLDINRWFYNNFGEDKRPNMDLNGFAFLPYNDSKLYDCRIAFKVVIEKDNECSLYINCYKMCKNKDNVLLHEALLKELLLTDKSIINKKEKVLNDLSKQLSYSFNISSYKYHEVQNNKKYYYSDLTSNELLKETNVKDIANLEGNSLSITTLAIVYDKIVNDIHDIITKYINKTSIDEYLKEIKFNDNSKVVLKSYNTEDDFEEKKYDYKVFSNYLWSMIKVSIKFDTITTEIKKEIPKSILEDKPIQKYEREDEETDDCISDTVSPLPISSTPIVDNSATASVWISPEKRKKMMEKEKEKQQKIARSYDPSIGKALPPNRKPKSIR
jgi:hypothetical protein